MTCKRLHDFRLLAMSFSAPAAMSAPLRFQALRGIGIPGEGRFSFAPGLLALFSWIRAVGWQPNGRTNRSPLASLNQEAALLAASRSMLKPLTETVYFCVLYGGSLEPGRRASC